MRTIRWSTDFKKDYRRIRLSHRHAQDIEKLLEDVVNLLVVDKALPESYRDHTLVGNWKGYRECHIKPDLLLIYKTDDFDLLKLARIGSHSEIFKK